MPDQSLVYAEAAPGIGLLRLNRPDRRNALDLAMGRDLKEAVAAAALDPGLRVLMVTGEGSAFCAGADLGELEAEVHEAADPRAELERYYSAFLVLRQLAIPTIALVNGAAVGAGANLALCCDLRIFAEEATLATPFVRLGIHPGGGCTFLLSRLAGSGVAREILFLGGAIGSARAQQAGLANQVVPGDELLATGSEWAERLARLPRLVLSELKESLRLAEDGGDFDSVLDRETQSQLRSMESEDAHEGWAAFRERRSPRFR